MPSVLALAASARPAQPGASATRAANATTTQKKQNPTTTVDAD